jgi:hypothetical protein
MTAPRTSPAVRPGMPDLHALATATAHGHQAIDAHIREVAEGIRSAREQDRVRKAAERAQQAAPPEPGA